MEIRQLCMRFPAQFSSNIRTFERIYKFEELEEKKKEKTEAILTYWESPKF